MDGVPEPITLPRSTRAHRSRNPKSRAARRLRNSALGLTLAGAAGFGMFWFALDHSPDRPLRASGAACGLEAGFTPSARPDTRLAGLVSHVEHVRIDAPIVADLAYVERVSLERAIQKSALPHVTGTYNLTVGRFSPVGSRRITCLSDGSSLVEEVLINERTNDTDRFRYMVWDYSTPQARGIHHAIGDFVRRAAGPNATEVTWTYGFSLRDNRFPGIFGALGANAFRRFFLDGDYAEMMRRSLAAEKAGVEARDRLGSPAATQARANGIKQ